MEQRDLAREPCPDRIVEDLGGAFGMGCVGGFLWHFGKGWYNSPKGEKFTSALYSGRMRAPVLGGNFAVWGGTFSSFDCALQYLRNKDDHWNAIASGAATGGVLALRGGWRAASRQAAVGAVLLAVIEGVMVIFSRTSKSTPRDQYYRAMEMERMQEQRRTATSSPDAQSSATAGFQLPSWLKPTAQAEPVGSATLSSDDSSAFSFSTDGDLSSTPENAPQVTGSYSPFSSSSFSSEYAPEGGVTAKKNRWRLFA